MLLEIPPVKPFPLLSSFGATHRTWPWIVRNHSKSCTFKMDFRKTSYLYLTEVSHFVGHNAYVFGGGLVNLKMIIKCLYS